MFILDLSTFNLTSKLKKLNCVLVQIWIPYHINKTVTESKMILRFINNMLFWYIDLHLVH